MTLIKDIRFIPVRKRIKGHVGFIHFTYNNDIALKNVAVYQRLDGAGYRLVYPEARNEVGELKAVVFPINRETQQLIEHEVNAYLTENCEKELS